MYIFLIKYMSIYLADISSDHCMIYSGVRSVNDGFKQCFVIMQRFPKLSTAFSQMCFYFSYTYFYFLMCFQHLSTLHKLKLYYLMNFLEKPHVIFFLPRTGETELAHLGL